MLILGTVGIAVTALAGWSALHGQNGFTEVVRMLRGEPAFVVDKSASTEQSGGGGSRKPDDDRDDDVKYGNDQNAVYNPPTV